MMQSNWVADLTAKSATPSLLVPQHQYAGAFEVVVPYTTRELAARTVDRASTLLAGLNAILKLVMVYIAPYPTDLVCPAAIDQYLSARLRELASRTGLESSIHLVVARNHQVAFRHVLRPRSVILLGSRKRFWRTREEHLARELAALDHSVTVLHFD